MYRYIRYLISDTGLNVTKNSLTENLIKVISFGHVTGHEIKAVKVNKFLINFKSLKTKYKKLRNNIQKQIYVMFEKSSTNSQQEILYQF